MSLGRKTIAVAVGIVVFAASVLPFLAAVRYGIVNLDDYLYVTEYDAVVGGLTWGGVAWAFRAMEQAMWAPLMWMSYMLDYTVSKAMGWDVFHVIHAGSIAVHGINAVLLWRLLVRIAEECGGRAECSPSSGGDKGFSMCVAAALASLLWAVHPLRVESVVAVMGRKDVLSMFWFLLALHAWVRWRVNVARQGWGLYALSIALWCVGFMCKPSVMVFPAVALAVDLFLLRKVRGGVRSLLPYVFPCVVAVGMAVLAAWFQSVGGASGAVDTPLWWRVVNAAAAIGVYAKNTVWPLELAAQCELRYPGMPRMWMFGCAVTGLAAWLTMRKYNELRARRFAAPERAEPWAAGLMWYGAAIVPFLGISQFGYHAFADRFTYIPSLGLSVALAAALTLSRGNWRRAMACACLALAIALGLTSWWQTGFWKDDKSLWTRTLEVDGDRNLIAHTSLGIYHFEYGHDLDEVIRHYAIVMSNDTQYVAKNAYLYMFALCEKDRMDEAKVLLDWYARWSQLQNDAMNAREGISATTGGFHADIPLQQYAYSRVAYFMKFPDMRVIAEEELSGMLAHHPGIQTLNYLSMRLCEAKGDAAGAEKWRRKVILGWKRSDYMRYRFLRKAGEDGGEGRACGRSG